MGWANRITLARALVTGGLWALLALAAPDPSTTTWAWAFGLFVFAGVTDAVDGIVARRFGDVSVLGRIADPLVDKLLVLGTMVVLLGIPSVGSVLPAWAVALILAREMVVTGIRAAVEATGASFAASFSGKAKMVVQCVAVGAVMLHGARCPLALFTVAGWSGAQIAVALAVLLTVASGVDSTVRAARVLRRAR
jgi:CDP-diacylglycerol--glycerol-3-phosphate 3-phosphatidyltransferase